MNLRTRPTAEEIKAMLGLEPHPTCGFVAETYRSTLKIPGNALPAILMRVSARSCSYRGAPSPHTSRLAPGADYALLASTEWPGVDPPDVEHRDVEALAGAYPDFREEILAFSEAPQR